MSKKTKDLPLRIIKPPLDVALEELKKQQKELRKREESQIVNSPSTVTTAVDTNTEGKPKKEKKPGEKESQFTFEYLDATHTSAEAKVYSVMYRECMSQNTNQLRFGLTQLKEKTGLSDKTIRLAIHSLEEKLSIKTTAPSEGVYGRKFHVFSPKEILTARRKAGIEIEPHTKRIISKGGSTVATAESTAVDSAVKSTVVSAVKPTAVSAVKSTALDEDTPYISKNIINRDDSIKDIESSSKSSSNIDDTDDESFGHRVYIISLYEKYTGNQWRVGDNEFYESESLEDILPEIVEAAIIASVLRSKTKINSFAYCEGAIHEFQENLPLGYLSYLREKWRDIKGREVNE